jgi:hypothetical protein
VGRQAWRFVLPLYLALRISLSSLAALIYVLYSRLYEDRDLSPHPILRPYLGLSPLDGGLRGLLLGVWQRWDTLWYLLIARRGYSLENTSIFAPPLYPWLMRGLGRLMGGSDAACLLAGLLISNAACLLSFLYLYRLVEMETDAATARRSLIYLALFPTAFFLLVAYAESLLLLCAVAALYYARRGQWRWAGLWAFLAPLARLPGSALIVPLGWEFGRQWQDSRRTSTPRHWTRAWPLALGALGSVAFPLYARFVLGAEGLLAPFAVHSQRFAGRFALPGQSILHAIRVLASGSFRLIEPFDLAFALLFAALTLAAFWRLPTVYAIYMAVMWLAPTSKTAEIQPLLSVSRYMLMLFPAFILLAQLGQRSPWWNRAILYPSTALSIFLTGQFVLWGWVG